MSIYFFLCVSFNVISLLIMAADNRGAITVAQRLGLDFGSSWQALGLTSLQAQFRKARPHGRIPEPTSLHSQE